MRTLVTAAAAVLLILGTGAFAAREASFSKDQKAFYLSEAEQAFIRPGLGLTIEEASIDEQGLIKYRFKITDPGGLPLDLNGIFSPGPVTIRSVAAVLLPPESNQYDAYTTRTKNDPESGRSSVQATSDSGGTFERIALGEYVYTFATRAPSGYDPSASHRIAAWARRDLEEFGLGEEATSDTFDFVPDGSTDARAREIVNDEACNSCHGKLAFHDQRTGVNLCITCHYPATNPESDNSIDFKVMVHKIHAGVDLPSVQAGDPYFFVGFGGRIVDYSDVKYPPEDLRFCETCHTSGVQAENAPLEAQPQQSTQMLVPTRSRGGGAAQRAELLARVEQAQGEKWLTNPGRAQCGSCHDDVNFATGENHAGLPQVSDGQCNRCHIPEGELEYDLSIIGSHTVERYSKELPGVNFELLDIVDTGAGEKPTVTFSIKDDAGDPILPSDVSRLNLYLAGSTTDISQWISEGASGAQGDGGVYNWTFENPIPADAVGSWAVGIEGQVPRTILAGTQQERNVNEAGFNEVRYFSVTDTETRSRRTVVALERCANCHVDFTLHGGPRNNPQFCVFCHNPNGSDVNRRPEDEMPQENINFKDMIHRLHAGQAQSRDYTIYGFGGTPHNYNDVRYPNSLAACDACHVDGSQNVPGDASALLPSVTPRDPFFDPLPPVTGSCLSCHTSQFAAAHADVNISDRLGESCAACHGDDKSFSVERVHAR